MISQRNKQIYSCRAEHNRHNETDRINSAQSSLNSIPVRVTFIFKKSRLNSGLCAIELTGKCCYNRFRLTQGCKARKVISEVYTSLVQQCTVSGR